MAPLGKGLIAIGLVLIAVGSMLWGLGYVPIFGHLPGDIQFLHNHTILHARTAFAPAPVTSSGSDGPAGSGGSGERHLQGCYADIDGLLSTLAVLRRGQTPTSHG